MVYGRGCGDCRHYAIRFGAVMETDNLGIYPWTPHVTRRSVLL